MSSKQCILALVASPSVMAVQMESYSRNAVRVPANQHGLTTVHGETFVSNKENQLQPDGSFLGKSNPRVLFGEQSPNKQPRGESFLSSSNVTPLFSPELFKHLPHQEQINERPVTEFQAFDEMEPYRFGSDVLRDSEIEEPTAQKVRPSESHKEFMDRLYNTGLNPEERADKWIEKLQRLTPREPYNPRVNHKKHISIDVPRNFPDEPIQGKVINFLNTFFETDRDFTYMQGMDTLAGMLVLAGFEDHEMTTLFNLIITRFTGRYFMNRGDLPNHNTFMRPFIFGDVFPSNSDTAMIMEDRSFMFQSELFADTVWDHTPEGIANILHVWDVMFVEGPDSILAVHSAFMKIVYDNLKLCKGDVDIESSDELYEFIKGQKLTAKQILAEARKLLPLITAMHIV